MGAWTPRAFEVKLELLLILFYNIVIILISFFISAHGFNEYEKWKNVFMIVKYVI